VAATIHRLGSADDEPFVVFDCAAPGRRDDMLFGHVDDRPRRPDALERIAPDSLLASALGGTLFLANVLDLSASAQARLARLLRDGEARSSERRAVIPLDVRLVGGCDPAIDDEVEAGAFRTDLVRRLAAIRIDLPPLRQRPEDVSLMVRHLAAGSVPDHADVPDAPRFTSAALGFLAALPWDGNLRELATLLEALAARGAPGPVRVEDLVPLIRFSPSKVPARLGSLREARRQFEREYIAAVLRQHGWKMGEAARALGIQRTNLYRKTRQLGISRAKGTG